MTLDELRRQAQTDWDDFIRPDRPCILVGSATCGRAAGSLDVIASFREEFRKQQGDRVWEIVLAGRERLKMDFDKGQA